MKKETSVSLAGIHINSNFVNLLLSESLRLIRIASAFSAFEFFCEAEGRKELSVHSPVFLCEALEIELEEK